MINDILAFTTYDPDSIEGGTKFFGIEGSDSLEGDNDQTSKPKSLIEELEMRKAGRKARNQLAKAVAIQQFDTSLGAESKRFSRHPLDVRQSRSLMELQHLANRDYDKQVHVQSLQRNSKIMRNSMLSVNNDIPKVPTLADLGLQQEVVDFMPDEANESLSARRARLRKMKQELEAESEQVETLAQRKARLRKERQRQQQQQQVFV